MPKRSQCSATPNRILADRGFVRVELGQRRQVPPGPVAEAGEGAAVAAMDLVDDRRVRVQGTARGEAVAVEVEPACIRRVKAVLDDVVEGPEATASVVEDTVEDDPHPSVVRRVEQLPQRRIATEERIDMEVVVGVIAVVRGRGEDRGQVESGDADRLQVGQPLDDPQEVTALEAVPRRCCVPRLEGAGLGDPRAGREAVREDLVEDRVTDPGRRVDRHRSSVGRARRARGTLRGCDHSAAPACSSWRWSSSAAARLPRRRRPSRRRRRRPRRRRPHRPAIPAACIAPQPTPELGWWNDRVFYEIFVRSFQDSDGDGIGDLRGLIDRLDYLNDGDPATTDRPRRDGDLADAGLRGRQLPRLRHGRLRGDRA